MNKSKIENYQKIPSLEQNLNSFPSKNLLTKKPSIIEENECFFEENIKAEKIILDLKPKSNYFFNKEKVPENERTPKSVQSQKSLFSKTQLLKTKTEILIPSSKIIEKETEKLKIDIFYIYEFENGKTYKNFFPNGNCENIIQKINRRMRNHDTTKISVRRKTLRIKRNLSGKKNNSKIFSPGLNENENNSPFRRIEELH